MGYSKELIKQYRTIQDSGVTNMLDRNAVAQIGIEHNLFDIAEIASDRKEYANFLVSFKKEWLQIEPDKELVEEIRANW